MPVPNGYKLVDKVGGMGANANDDIHPNAKGYAIMEAAVLPIVLSLN